MFPFLSFKPTGQSIQFRVNSGTYIQRKGNYNHVYKPIPILTRFFGLYKYYRVYHD